MDMNCPRCGKPIGVGATFCMHCGQMFAAVSQGQAPMTPVIPAAMVPVQASRTRSMVAGAALTLLVLAAVVWGLNSAGVLRLGGGSSPGSALKQAGEGQGGNSLLAPGAGDGGSMLEAQGNSDPGAMLPSQAERARMPQDVYDWLLFLEQIERKKERLNSRQMDMLVQLFVDVTKASAGAGMLDMDGEVHGSPEKNPASDLQASATDLAKGWDALVKEFTSRTPPRECNDLYLRYDEALTQIKSQIGDIQGILGGDLSSALVTVRKWKGASEGTVDSPLDDSDKLLGQICAKYDVRKWFGIASHHEMPSMFGAGGAP